MTRARAAARPAIVRVPPPPGRAPHRKGIASRRANHNGF